MEEIKKDFEEWCEKNTAGFGSDDGDEFNISWDDLQFYDNLVFKFNQSIDLAVSKEREHKDAQILEFIRSGKPAPWNDTGWSVELSDVEKFIINTK